MSQEYQHHGSRIILASLGLCISILKNTQRQNQNPLLTSVWSEPETANLIDYLYQRRGEISEGIFPSGTFSDLAIYLNRRHPISHRTHKLVLAKFALLKDAIAIIDRYNEVHGRGPDPSIVFVPDTGAFNMYLLTIPPADRKVLERYRHRPFLLYEKFKAILLCIECTSLGLPSRHSTPNLPSGLPSIGMASKLPSKRRHIETSIVSRPAKRRRIDDAGSQSSYLEMTPIETVANILDSVEFFIKTLRQPPPPPSPLLFCTMAATKATNALSRNCSLSNEQKVQLRLYYCKNPVDAACLPEDNALLDIIFQNMLKRPDVLTL